MAHEFGSLKVHKRDAEWSVHLVCLVLIVLVGLGALGETYAQNAIVLENQLTGSPSSEWDVIGAGDPSIQGFATEFSLDQGEVVQFKILTDATDYRLDVYRMGYYSGDGARLVATVQPSATLPQTQPTCIDDALTNLLDCGSWSVSASWAVPAIATSGIYFARLVREDGGGNGDGSHVFFVIRDDDGASDLLFQTSDTTWQAYNRWGEGDIVGGNSLYTGPDGKATRVSYNRPFSTRQVPSQDWVFNAEYPMVRWLERNGYGVSYFTNIDTDRLGGEILEHQVFLSVGHDEYWSRAMRENVEAARDSGVHLAFFSGNEVYWKVRWEDSVDGSGTSHRTLVCYKEGTLGELSCGGKCDPLPDVWTGLWRDGCAESPPADGCDPENALTGQISWAGSTGQITVPQAFGGHPFWQNTSVATLQPGQTETLATGSLGYEWDPQQPAFASFYPAGIVALSDTNYGGQNHRVSLYEAPSGALVFGAGSVQWSWGLDIHHDRGQGASENVTMQQSTVNLLGLMGVQAGTLQANLVPFVPCVPDCTGMVCGDDGCGGSCGDCVPGSTTCEETTGQCVACDLDYCSGRECGDDDCGGICGSCAAAERCNEGTGICESLPCPCSLWDTTTIPANLDNNDPNAIEIGVRFQSAVDGYITGIRFYKTLTNTGAHVGNLWTETGQNLGSVAFVGETASGWQEATFTSPIPVTAGTNYVASCHMTSGDYAINEYYFSTSGWSNYPLSASRDGLEGGGANGVYAYSAVSAFPTATWHSSNFWVDPVFDTTAVDVQPPSLLARSPALAASSVPTTTAVTATFNEVINESTLTFELRDPSAAMVAAIVTYDTGMRTATLTPDLPLDPNTTYEATIGAEDGFGNMMPPDSWSFTSGELPAPPPDEGPGGPILVIADVVNPFGRYFAEIVRTEGMNYFTVTDITSVDASVLAQHEVVILGEMSLLPTEVTLLTSWVDGGGKLIAMRPDAQLAGVLGLSEPVGTLSNAYLRIDTATPAGSGLVDQTVQFHGSADLYTLDGASSIATLYSDAVTATTNPAVTLHGYGTNGGVAAAFAYDLARSVVYTRQGNPVWVGQDRDGIAPLRANDMFFGAADGDPQPDWIDLGKVAIPQADEQQRLLAQLIFSMNEHPLPRFWYFPSGHKAVVIMTGDQHGCCDATASRFDLYLDQSPPGCSLEDWECVRASSYVYPGSGTIDAAFYASEGFEFGVHVDTGCSNWTPSTLASFYATQMQTFAIQFPGVPAQMSHRTHCIAWSDWATQAAVEYANGIRLDVNYYYWPPTWANNRPGLFTGSGMPMRFADLDGTMIDVYQATSQMTDESGQTFPFTIDTLLDRALGPQGYYGAFTANMHTDQANHAESNAIVASAQARGVPVVSGRQMLEWLDGRNASAFGNMAWDGTNLTFDLTVGTHANNLQGMVPASHATGQLTSLTRDGIPAAFTTETIKGTNFAVFDADPGSYDASFAPDTTGPVISNIQSEPNTDGTALISWDTDEPSDSLVQYGTDPDNLASSVSDGTDVLQHSITLNGLDAATTIYYQVTSEDASSNATTAPETPASFTTPAATCFLDEVYSDFAAGSQGADTFVTLTTDGEVILKPVEAEEFEDALDTWQSYPWAVGGTTTVSAGSVTVDATRVNSPDESGYAVGAGHVLEFVATFGGDRLQHVGFGGGTNIITDGGLFNATPWLLFSTGSSGGALQARVNVSGVLVEDIPIPGSYLGTPHRYRIEWTASAVEFFIDGASVHSAAVAVGTNLRPAISDFDPGGDGLSVDWIRLTPHAAAGSFESRVYDALASANWGAATWNMGAPAGSGVELNVRTGDTPTPDGSWTAYTLVSQGGLVGGSTRYVQYRADLSTTDIDVTPVLEDVLISCSVGGDTTPPGVLSTVPVDQAIDIPLDTTISINYDEPIDTATFSATISNGASHTISFLNGDATVELTPDTALTSGTLYAVTIVAGVEDLAGNPTVAQYSFDFTTLTLPCFVDDFSDDFGAGNTGPDTYVSRTDDGEVTLKPTLGEEFDGTDLPGGWESFNGSVWGGGAATVGDGQLTVNGARANTTAPYDPDAAGTTHSLEFIATFSSEFNQHIGLSDNFNSRWAIFSTKSTTTTLHARANPGSSDGFAIDPALYGLTPLVGSPHRYRIDWNPDSSVDFYIDDLFITTVTGTSLEPMSPIVSDLEVNSELLVVDWMRMGPYSLAGGFESRVLDAGSVAAWETTGWTSLEPAGTNVAISVRTGDTETPDGTWSAFSSVTQGGSIGGASRYLQYRADLSTADTAITPSFDDLTIDCLAGSDVTPPVVSNVAATPDVVTALITWDTNETADSLVEYGTDPDSLEQSRSDAALVTAHSVLLADLLPNTVYYYRVKSEDAATNLATEPPGLDLPLEFTTLSPVCATDTRLADFSAGTGDGFIYFSETDDGEVILDPTEGGEFEGTLLPAGWDAFFWDAAGTAVVSDGALTIDGVRVNPINTNEPSPPSEYGPGRSLEFVATFGASAFQHVGFGGGIDSPAVSWQTGEMFNVDPWALFSTGSGSQLQARAWNGGGSLDTDLGAQYLGSEHLYRIDWSATNIDFYIDGTLAHSEAIAITRDMRPGISDLIIGGGTLTVDWIHMSPYSASGLFESRVHDAGESVSWGEISWSSTEPAGTSVAIAVRTGETAVPDGSWTSYAPIVASGDSVDEVGRYLQYEAAMASADPDVTPALLDVTVECAAVSCAPVATDDVTCDGIDDDCDGEFDEDYAPDAGCFLPGVCAAGNQASTCVDGSETACQPGEPTGADNECNDVDEDCSGVADDNYVPDTGCFLSGVCSAGNQASTCLGGDETLCRTGTPTAEICDGLDNDCDNLTDDDDDDVTDQTTWYADGDGDSFGNAALPQLVCEQPTGYVLDDTDCDDGDANAFPGNFETCDGVDNDCSNSVDDGGAALCDNGIYCDGAEICDAAAGCKTGNDPCPGQICNETSETCEARPPTDVLGPDDFESSFGSWSNVGDDDLDWTRNSGGTSSNDTGPTADHTTDGSSGFYLYTEASTRAIGYPNRTALLESPCLDLSGYGIVSWTFWYHMVGSSMGSIYAEVAPDCGTTWNTEFTLSDEQQTAQNDAYLEANVDLTAYVGTSIRLRFRGVTGTSWSSDMAIDDVHVEGRLSCGGAADCDDGLFCNGTEACVANACVPGTPIDCGEGSVCVEETDSCAAPTPVLGLDDFESSFGSWSNVGGDDIDWTRDSAGTPSGDTGPTGDHTTDSSSGFYLYTEASTTNGNPNKTALLESPCLDLSGYGNVSWTFWYHMVGSSMGSIYAEVAPDCGTIWNTKFTLSDEQQASQSDAYLEANIDLSAYAETSIRLRFRGVTGTSWSSDMAIDDIFVEGVESGVPCGVHADCDDHLYCNGAEICDAGSCQAGAPVICDDGIGCTVDSCNETAESCDATPNTGACDNGVFCDGVETCDAVNDCQAGTPVNCDDGVGCTTDACNESTDSCGNLPDHGACANGSFCDGAEICDVVNDCQAGNNPCVGQFCDEGGDICFDCMVPSDCDDGQFCNGVESCVAGFCNPGGNPCPGQTCDEAGDTCISGPVAQLETHILPVGAGTTTVNLTNTYVSAVVVCSVQYNNNTTPVVARVSAVSGTSFDVRLQNPSGVAVAADNVNCLIVEEGAWSIDGVKIEAQTYTSTVTDENNLWTGEPQSYLQSYSNPVVLGQVMTENDSDWSVFWCQGTARGNPPSSAALRTGKTVCEDSDTTRADETVGFVVIESGSYTINGVQLESIIGAKSVRGVDNGPPFEYLLSPAFGSAPQVVLTTMAGVAGGNGGWSQTHGPTQGTNTGIYLSVDEDQIADSERRHTTERVGCVVFQAPFAYRATAGLE